MGGGGDKKNSPENDQLTGHFQCFFLSFSELLKVKLVRVNQQSVSNLKIFHNLPKNVDRTITFNSVTLKITQTEPQKCIISFNETNTI